MWPCAQVGRCTFIPRLSAAVCCRSPVGPLTAPESRKTLINLILVLNATFPDYDFSSLR